MKIDLSNDIDNLAYLNYMQEQEKKETGNKESNYNKNNIWYENDAPQDKKQD